MEKLHKVQWRSTGKIIKINKSILDKKENHILIRSNKLTRESCLTLKNGRCIKKKPLQKHIQNQRKINRKTIKNNNCRKKLKTNSF
jgi:hypothetical protein